MLTTNDVKLANYTKQMRFFEETSGDEVFCLIGLWMKLEFWISSNND